MPALGKQETAPLAHLDEGLRHAPSQCRLLTRCQTGVQGLQADEAPRLPRISFIERLYRYMWRRKVVPAECIMLQSQDYSCASACTGSPGSADHHHQAAICFQALQCTVRSCGAVQPATQGHKQSSPGCTCLCTKKL